MCSLRTSLTQRFVWPGLVPLESTDVLLVANVGSSLSTEQNVQLPFPLTGFCTCGKVTLKIFTESAILKGTVTTSTKERCAWDSGLVIVRVILPLTPTQVTFQCPGSSLKKFLKPRFKSQAKPSILHKRINRRKNCVFCSSIFVKFTYWK